MSIRFLERAARSASIVVLAWVAASAAGLLACSKKAADADDDSPIRPKVASTSAGSAAPSASAHTAPAPAPPLAARTVEEGRTADGRVWLPKFDLVRDAGEAPASLSAAWDACGRKGRVLCSESQWERACGADAAVGAVESWTSTSAGADGIVARGGTTGCAARTVLKGEDLRLAHAATCCDPAVGIVSENKNRGFLLSVSDKMTRYEKGLNKRSGAALAPFVDESMSFFGKPMRHDAMVAKYDAWFRQFPDQWTLYDVCDVAIQAGTDPTWTGDCTTTAHKGGEVAFVTTRYTWSGGGKVQRVEELSVLRKFAPL